MQVMIDNNLKIVAVFSRVWFKELVSDTYLVKYRGDNYIAKHFNKSGNIKTDITIIPFKPEYGLVDLPLSFEKNVDLRNVELELV